MDINDKKKRLFDWIENLDEQSIDELIAEYLEDEETTASRSNTVKYNNYSVDQRVLTPKGKAVIKIVDHVQECVRVKHLEASTPVTDYRFSDLKPIKD